MRPCRCHPVLVGTMLCSAALTMAAALRPALAGPESGPGGRGAQVYCFMRSNGNNHQVSWDAAYALIKRQSASLFKTSPEHAAVMITEAVVQNPGAFPDCGRFLGDLYLKPVTPEKSAAPAAPTTRGGAGQTRSEMPASQVVVAAAGGVAPADQRLRRGTATAAATAQRRLLEGGGPGLTARAHPPL